MYYFQTQSAQIKGQTVEPPRLAGGQQRYNIKSVTRQLSRVHVQ